LGAGFSMSRTSIPVSPSSAAFMMESPKGARLNGGQYACENAYPFSR
jgi:hypothetical protein